ncbi:hypothetical protein [Kaistella sp. PBT33-4]|uniref:hypothetical protein n=1 Tax=Kaistella sp. PBT33-4 TaxID=3032000 RepID=UPI0023D83250|nr:hypothetical protein [Kaistella sp. PBT33-4]
MLDPNDPNPFKLTLSYALATDYRLETANSNTGFLKKLIRESATQFIDIAAFYGMHAQGKGKVHTQSGLTTNPDTIYALIGNFLTKNTVYLYIQSNRQRSYNFYGNYDLNGNNFKIGFDLSNLIEKKFGTESWPIEEISNVGAQQDKLYLKFLHSREFNIPALCSFNKNLENTTSVYFANREELIDTNSTNPIGYTNEIEVSLEKVNNYQISEPIFIGYLGNYFGIDNYQVFPLSKKSNYFLLHSIFSLVDTKSNLIQDEGSISILEYHKTSPIALLSYKDVFLVGSKVITDFGEKLITPNNSVSKRRKTFISHILRIPDNLNLKNSRFFNPNNLSLKSSKEKIFEFIYGEKEFSLNSFLLTENGVDFKTLSLKYNDAIINEYFHLGITNEEFEILKQLIPAQAYSVRFKFNDETNYNMDFENDVVFYKFSLGIIYENSLGNLEEIFPSLPINVYGIKINFLASKEYADFENKAFEKQDIL